MAEKRPNVVTAANQLNQRIIPLTSHTPSSNSQPIAAACNCGDDKTPTVGREEVSEP